MITSTPAGQNGVATRNALYLDVLPDYVMLRDAEAGRTRVVDRGDFYLPRPPALAQPTIDPDGKKYRWLLSHAEYPEVIVDGLAKMQGIVHAKLANVALPTSMEYLLERATPDGKSLHELFMTITAEVFLMGGVGVLPEVYGDEVLLCTYAAERIINWRIERSGESMLPAFVVLHEPVDVAGDDPFSAVRADRYRVVRNTPTGYEVEVWQVDSNGNARVVTSAVRPSVKGRRWTAAPFVRINADDLEIEPGKLPLRAAAYKALDYYRKSAGFNRAIYNKEDPPMLRVGISQEEAESMTTVGGQAVWDAANPTAQASYIELKGDALELALKVMASDLAEARAVIGKLIDDAKGGVESGEALRERRAANAVSLASMVRMAARGMEKVLRNVAEVLGANPSDVMFEPTLDFLSPVMTPKDALDLIGAKNAGFPISLKAVHEQARRGGLTTMTFDDEMEEISEEDPTGMLKPDVPGMADVLDDPGDDPLDAAA